MSIFKTNFSSSEQKPCNGCGKISPLDVSIEIQSDGVAISSVSCSSCIHHVPISSTEIPSIIAEISASEVLKIWEN